MMIPGVADGYVLLRIRKLLQRLQAPCSRFRSARHRKTALLIARLNSCRLEWPASVPADVPVRCYGQGTIVLGEEVRFGFRASMRLGNGEILLSTRTSEARISIGARAVLNNNCSITAKTYVEVGAECLLGVQVMISDFDAHAIDPAVRRSTEGVSRPVRLERNVWIGNRVTILKGVSIGENSIIAAGAVVTKSVPPNVIAAGVPAKVVRHIVEPSAPGELEGKRGFLCAVVPRSS